MAVTDFQGRVYEAVRKIPRGQVCTYGELARAIGCGSARAVGQALRVNPFVPEVPCHRVVRSDYRVGGYLGNGAGRVVGEKLERLAEEGVEFDERGVLKERGRLFVFASG